MTIANPEMAAAWDGAEGEHWALHADRYEAITVRYWEHLRHCVPIEANDVVLDVGCGTGRSSRDLARLVTSGSVLGVDLSARMLERGRAAAESEGLSNLVFVQADAQVHRFADARFDLAVSSFGAMFFADPVAAFTNIGLALGPGGRLALLAWRDMGHNEWVAALRDVLSAGRSLPQPPRDAPGPFGLARRQHVEQVLAQAGFVDIALEEVAEPIRFGNDVDDAFSFVSTLGITRGLTNDLDASATTAALDALRRLLAEHETDEGVVFAGSAWLITAGRSAPVE